VTGPARRALRPRALLATLAVAGTLAGCGGQATEVREAGAYADRVNQVQTQFERDLTSLDRAADAAEDRRDVERAVQRLSDRIAGVQRELRAVRPPAAVAAAHARLIAAFGRWSAPLQAFRRALRDRDSAATLRAKTAFNTETATVEQEVNAAARAINDRLRSLAD
jgi:hypothetical protein